LLAPRKRIPIFVWGSAIVLEAAVEALTIETSSTGLALTFTRIVPRPLVAVLPAGRSAGGERSANAPPASQPPDNLGLARGRPASAA
jgi:hypothetical protein